MLPHRLKTGDRSEAPMHVLQRTSMLSSAPPSALEWNVSKIKEGQAFFQRSLTAARLIDIQI
jgi:hypothetical protein